MDRFESISPNSIPIFDGKNYALWGNRMHTYLMDIGVDVWQYVEHGYKPPKPHQLIPSRRNNLAVITKQGTISCKHCHQLFYLK
jgi:hypothetical protein